MSGHGRVVCSCGAVITQCRCMENHNIVETRPNGCRDCYDKLPKAHAVEVPIEEYEKRLR